jgi:hypothetical protein
MIPSFRSSTIASATVFGTGSTVANAVIAKIGAAAKVCLFSYAPIDLVVDVNGSI